jgi:hypothetical protein
MRRLLPLALLAALPACGGSAVLVAETPRGGVFSLDGDHASAMSDMRRQIGEHCAGSYRILPERRALTGWYRGEAFVEDLAEFVCEAPRETR